MTVLITMQVGPVDTDRFMTAAQALEGRKHPGFHQRRVYTADGDPKTVLVMEEWDSHDAFHAATEKEGEEFNRLAGTEGLNWITGVWTQASP